MIYLTIKIGGKYFKMAIPFKTKKERVRGSVFVSQMAAAEEAAATAKKENKEKENVTMPEQENNIPTVTDGTGTIAEEKLTDNMADKTQIHMSAPINETESVMIYGSDVIFTEDDKENPPYSLQSYQGPVFFMCPPFGASNGIANNTWMAEEDEPMERDIYMEEWLRLYKDLSSIGMVYIAPTHPKLQDQVYISNGFWVPPHAPDYCLMPNFRVLGRKASPDLGIPGENAVNEPFMKILGYKTVHLPEEIDGEPCYFEGEADIKLINSKDEHGCVYVCGVGIRTSENAARWIENWLNEIDPDPNSHHKVISLPQKNKNVYHCDCVCEPADADHTLVYIDPQVDASVYEEIAKHTKIIPLNDKTIAEAGACNFVRAGNFIFINSDIQMLEGSAEFAEDYEIEKKKLEFVMENVCKPLGLELNVYCLSQAILGGACLSCLVATCGWDLTSGNNWKWKY